MSESEVREELQDIELGLDRLYAIHELTQTPGWSRLLEFLKLDAKDQADQLIHLDVRDVLTAGRLQGSIQAIRSLVEMDEGLNEQIDAARERQKELEEELSDLLN